MPLYQLFGGKCRKVFRYTATQMAVIFPSCVKILNVFHEMGITNIRCQCGGYGGESYGNTPATAPRAPSQGVYLDSRSYIRNTVKLFEGIRKTN